MKKDHNLAPKKINLLLDKIRSYNPTADTALIERAFIYTKEAHRGQKRLSGEPVFTHALAIANFLADWHLDTASIVAGLLHDVPEDTTKTLVNIEKHFGKEIRDLVDGLTRIKKIKLRGSNSEDFIENLRKMFLAMSRDLRVIIVKLADRYHNMLTLEYLPEEKQIGIAQETLEIFAPLAERLGMGQVKGELEDLAFPYCYPKEYQWLIDYTRPYYKKAEERIKEARRCILKNLAEEGLRVKVKGRVKTLYSLWRKLLRPENDRDINKIHDLVALMVITEKPQECYLALGIIHKVWQLVPYLGVRDWIAQPKPNGYQSIHTNVFWNDGQIIEFKIRTMAMHEQARYGVAAHWYLAEMKSKNKIDSKGIDNGRFFAPDKKMAWVNQLAAWQSEIVDSKEFIDSVKFDALKHRIFVFSPKGDAFDLPEGSTPVDFAYRVHTDLGNQTAGAKVDGRMVGLDYSLHSGEVVEILIDRKRKKPSVDWLDFVVTRLAQRKIRQNAR